MTDTETEPASGRWSRAYERLLRDFMPPDSKDVPLESSDALFDLGLDSFATVELLVALESTFGVSFPDDELTAETFATVGSLWAVLSGLLPEGAADEDLSG